MIPSDKSLAKTLQSRSTERNFWALGYHQARFLTDVKSSIDITWWALDMALSCSFARLAEAQVYGDKAMKKAANNWLTDVSRIQAHLGVLRLWKSGLWAGVSVIAIGFFGWKLSSFSQTTGLIVSIAGVAVATACNAIYWAKDPDPY